MITEFVTKDARPRCTHAITLDRDCTRPAIIFRDVHDAHGGARREYRCERHIKDLPGPDAVGVVKVVD